MVARRRSYDHLREWGETDGKIGNFEYSVGASRLDTDNARPTHNYAQLLRLPTLAGSPEPQLRIAAWFTYSVKRH